MKTIRNVINEQNDNISFCGDTEEVLRQNALEDIKELEKEIGENKYDKYLIDDNASKIRYIKFKYNLDEEE